MTTNAEVKSYLHHALLQLAAESYLHKLPIEQARRDVELLRRFKYGFNDPTHPFNYRRHGFTDTGDDPMLPSQNRLVGQQALDLVTGYAMVEQHANDQTGFSATLLKRNGTTDEYVLAFRSTEFRQASAAGDRERDHQSGAGGEIVQHGFAFGQLAAMEEYYRELRNGRAGELPLLPTDAKLTVTGYSLGAHLATVFTLMHSSEIVSTYTYNAAGHGVIRDAPTNGENVQEMLAAFTEFLLAPGGALASAAIAGVVDTATKAELSQMQTAAVQEAVSASNPFAVDSRGLGDEYEFRSSVYDDTRYAFAKALIQQQMPTRSLALSVGNINGSVNGTDAAYEKITQIYGLATHDDQAIVANSQTHTPNLVRVFIEDQPDLWGTGGATGDGDLSGNFGPTHALILVIDSLALIDVLQIASPGLSMEQAGAILAAASNMRAEGGLLLKGRSESNSNENVLDALRRLVASPSERPGIKPTNSDPVGDGFGRYDFRTEYYDNLNDVREKLLGLAGTSIGSLVSGGLPSSLEGPSSSASALPNAFTSGEIVNLAKSDLGYRVALKELNPFALLGLALYAEYRPGGALASQLDVFDPQAGLNNGALSLQWLADRAEFLRRKLVLNLHNLNNDVSKRVNVGAAADPMHSDATAAFRDENVAYVDLPSGYRIDFGVVGAHQRIAFGGDGADLLMGGGLQDRLFGGSGADLLHGGGENDYLEGGAGVDIYQSSASKNFLGIAANDGHDEIRDTDGKGVLRYEFRDGASATAVSTWVIGGVAIGSTVDEWQGVGGRFVYARQGADLKVMITGDAGGSITIKDFDFAKSAQSGYLGIRLIDAPAVPVFAVLPAPETTRDISGDFESLKQIATVAAIEDPAAPEGYRPEAGLDWRGYVIRGISRDPDDNHPIAYEVEYTLNDDIQNMVHTLTPASGQGDFLNDSTGNDKIVAGGGNNTVLATRGGNDWIVTGGGIDTVTDSIGNNLIDTGGGNDNIFTPGTGNDNISSGAGNDTIADVAGSNRIDAGADNDAINTGGGDDWVLGGDGNDSITDTGGRNLLEGGSGRDFIRGGDGEDWIEGGTEADILSGAGGKDTLWAEASGGIAGIAAAISQGESGIQRLGRGDLLSGDMGEDILLGGAGADYLAGGDGRDLIAGGIGDDTIYGDGIVATVPLDWELFRTVDDSGALVSYVVTRSAGFVGSDVAGDADAIYGGAGADWIFAGNGDDFVNAGTGEDVVLGEAGNDVLVGGGGRDILDGDSAQANAASTWGDDYLDGGAGDDVLFGGNGKDVLLGAEGLDQLLGGEHDDMLWGGAGADFLQGGAGKDTYVYYKGDGVDVVIDPDIEAGSQYLSSLVLGPDIKKSDVKFRLGSLVVDLGEGDEIHFQDFNHEDPLSTRVFDTIQFADGESMTFEDVLAHEFVLEGAAGDDRLVGTSLNEHIDAGEGNDYLFGGAGNDTLAGGAGTDAYFVRAGMDADIVTDGDAGEANVLLLGAGVTLQSIASRRVDDSLVLTLRGTEDSLTITDYYARPQAWMVRDVVGAETSLEAVIAQPDPYGSDFIARLWGDLKFGATANMMARAYEIGWKALDQDTFERFQDQANLEYSRQSTVTTLLRADPPFGVLNTSTFELEQETVRSFGLHPNSTFRWALQSLESARVESDAAVVVGGLGEQGIDETTGEAVLTLQRDGHIFGEQLTTWTTSGGVISFDTGTETVVAIISHDNELHSYRQRAEVMNVSPGAGTWPHETSSVVGDKALVDMVRLEHRHIGVLELIGGASDNQFATNGASFDFDTTLLVDAGAGNDLVLGGSLVYGNDGDDDLRGSPLLIGGNGNDRLEGSRNTRFVFTANETGVDAITASHASAVEYVGWYYDSIGISDWSERLHQGGRYAATVVVDGESSGTQYFGTLEEAEAEGGTDIRFVEPLDVFAPVVRRDDAATLNILATQSGLSRDVALFGPGITLEDLDISITVPGAAAAAYPAQPWDAGGTLSVRWNGGSAGFDVEVPDVNYGFTGANLILDGWEMYRIGEGLEAFEFADGGIYNLQQILQGATVVVDYGYAFVRGSGSQVIEPHWGGVNFIGDITLDEISAYRDGGDLVIVLADGSAQATIPGWYADPLAYSRWVLHLPDGTNLDAAATTELGFTRRGTEAADVLVGDPEMSSRLFGFGGDDTLIGGTGDDYLDGGEGLDTYLLGAESGADVIADAGPNVLVFDESVPSWSIDFSLGSLLLHYGDGDSVRFAAFDTTDPQSTPVFERLEFADGTTFTYADFLEHSFQHYGSEEDDVIAGTGIRDAIFGNGGDDTLYGRGGNDDLFGGDGNDTLWGGPGDADLMSGADGGDTYLYTIGDGRDEIYEWSETQDGTDRVVLQGFEVADVAVTRDLWNYYLVMADGDRLTLGDMLVEPGSVVEQVEFASGTVWSPEDLEARVVLVSATEGEDVLWGTPGADSILGLGGSDTLFGNAGDDFLAGGEGEDTYYFFAGDGSDSIDNLDSDGSQDSLYLAGVASTEAALARSGADLLLQLGADSIRLLNWYAEADRRIDYVAFESDGILWDAAMIEALAPVGGENSAPEVANPLVDRSFEAGSALEFLVPVNAFADADGEALELSASLYGGGALPAWLAFDPETGRFSGAPLATHIGISHIAVTATDPGGESVTSDFGLIVHAVAGSTVTGSAGNDHLFGGTGDETLIARGGSDYLFGDVGNDLLRGGAGTDVLQGGAGSDILRGGAGQNVLDGGAGDDLIYGGAGSGFIVGGAGNDTLRVGQGSDVIAYNSGDGMDTIYGGRDGGNTLSFGGGIRYSDIRLSKSGKDLVVSTGEGEGVTLKNWYGGNHSVLSLQVVLDATDEFDAASGDPLYNRRVQTFDFLGMASAYDAARAATPGLTSWEMTNALLTFHLGGADDAAIGGDLTYWYGRNRTLQGISVASAQQAIGTPGFGSEAQSLRPFDGLQEGFAKLA